MSKTREIPYPELGSVHKEIRFPDAPLIFSFSGLGDAFEFKGTLDELKVNVVYIRDLKHRWYLDGIAGIGEDVQSICFYLKQLILEIKPTKTIALGASAGGFAAMLYGGLLRLDKVLVFSPQTFMDSFHRTIYYDYRWKDNAKKIRGSKSFNSKYLDVKHTVKTFKGKVNIYYDKKHRLDLLHGYRIRGKNVTRVTEFNGGHNLVKYLKEEGKLLPIIKNYIFD